MMYVYVYLLVTSKQRQNESFSLGITFSIAKDSMLFHKATTLLTFFVCINFEFYRVNTEQIKSRYFEL